MHHQSLQFSKTHESEARRAGRRQSAASHHECSAPNRFFTCNPCYGMRLFILTMRVAQLCSSLDSCVSRSIARCSMARHVAQRNAEHAPLSYFPFPPREKPFRSSIVAPALKWQQSCSGRRSTAFPDDRSRVDPAASRHWRAPEKCALPKSLAPAGRSGESKVVLSLRIALLHGNAARPS